ncbi:MAG: flagellar FliJ family protein [Thermoguttaceae bacterium]
MLKFQFRLATLQKLREIARDERRTQLAESQRADAALEHEQAEVDAERGRLQGECRAIGGPGRLDLPRLAEVQRYAESLRRDAESLERQRRSLAVEIERRRLATIEADRDVRSLEKLREHQWAAHRQIEERQTVKRLDESAARAVAVARSSQDDDETPH